MSDQDCYKCVHRRNVPGDTHSSCRHPSLEFAFKDPILSLFGSLGKNGPFAGQILPCPVDCQVTANPHGVRMGWFVHPWNFDPCWLESCTGFKSMEKTS